MSVFVKICGITSEEDALLAVAMGADALGFVFAPSPRQVSPSIVSDIVKRLPPEILTIGVFRDESPERVADSVRFVIKGFRAGSAAVREATSFRADCILIDAPSPGSGELFDWSLAAEVPDGVRIMLAGGLTPENVADAVASVQPWAVDVSTGVEAAPGRKDAVRLRAFIANAKSVPLAEPLFFDGERP